MNIQKKLLAITALCGALFCATAQAATVSASASILDLSTSSNIVTSNDQYYTDATTPYQSSFGTGSVLQPFFFSTTQPNLDASFASVDYFISPLPGTQAGANHDGMGTATALWTFDYLATAAGTAVVDLQYSFNVLVSNLLAGETGIASASLTAFVDGTQVSSEVLNFFNNVEGQLDGIQSRQLSWAVTEGQTGTVTVALTSVAKASPVPVPAALPLLASGLAGLMGFARRRRRNA